jgi:hypothetical protein
MDRTYTGTLVHGQPVIQVSATPAIISAADGASQVIGVCEAVTGTTEASYAYEGVVATNRADLVVGTTYYAAAAGTFTATPGATSQRVGVAVSNSEIELSLVVSELPAGTSSMTAGATISAGKPVCQVLATPSTVVVSNGTVAVAGVSSSSAVGGGRVTICQEGTVETNRTDLVVGTTYYAAAAGTYTATVGAASQRLGVAVSNSAIRLDLGYL